MLIPTEMGSSLYEKNDIAAYLDGQPLFAFVRTHAEYAYRRES